MTKATARLTANVTPEQFQAFQEACAKAARPQSEVLTELAAQFCAANGVHFPESNKRGRPTTKKPKDSQ